MRTGHAAGGQALDARSTISIVGPAHQPGGFHLGD
jgi:hypothetical protein